MTKVAAYSTNAGEFVRADTTAGAFNVTLPSAIGISGQSVAGKKISADANAVTIDTVSSQTIDGVATLALPAQNNSVTLVSDGANWNVIA